MIDAPRGPVTGPLGLVLRSLVCGGARSFTSSGHRPSRAPTGRRSFVSIDVRTIPGVRINVDTDTEKAFRMESLLGRLGIRNRGRFEAGWTSGPPA